MKRKEKKDGDTYEAMNIFDLFGSDIYGIETKIEEPRPIIKTQEVEFERKRSLIEISKKLAARITTSEISVETVQEISADQDLPKVTKGKIKKDRNNARILADSYNTTSECRIMGAKISFEDEGANDEFRVSSTTGEGGMTEAIVSNSRTVFDFDDENGLPLNHNKMTKKTHLRKDDFKALWQLEARRRKELITQ